MGICCVSNGLDKKNGVNINELGHKSESIIKDINGAPEQSDDCSILVSNYNNEINYNVKYRESGNNKVYATKGTSQ